MSEDDFDLVALRRRWATIPERTRGVSVPEQTRDVVPRVGTVEALAHLAPLQKAIRRRFPAHAREASLLLDQITTLLSVESPAPASLAEADRLLVVLEELIESALMFPER